MKFNPDNDEFEICTQVIYWGGVNIYQQIVRMSLNRVSQFQKQLEHLEDNTKKNLKV